MIKRLFEKIEKWRENKRKRKAEEILNELPGVEDNKEETSK